jgi:hypothetical protein
MAQKTLERYGESLLTAANKASMLVSPARGVTNPLTEFMKEKRSTEISVRGHIPENIY